MQHARECLGTEGKGSHLKATSKLPQTPHCGAYYTCLGMSAHIGTDRHLWKHLACVVRCLVVPCRVVRSHCQGQAVT